MKVTVNFDKTCLIFFFMVIASMIGIGLVVAVGPPNPGHNVGEIGPGTFLGGGDYVFPSGGNVVVGDEIRMSRGTITNTGWPEGHYCILKSACDPCPPDFEQTHYLDLPNAGRAQRWGIHVGTPGIWDCTDPVGSSDCSANRPEAQWDIQGCWNAYLLFCCK